MNARKQSSVGRWVVGSALVAAVGILPTGCKSWPGKQPPLLDTRGMVPPPYSTPGADGFRSPPVEPMVFPGEVGVPYPAEPLPMVEVAPSLPSIALPPPPASQQLTYEVKKGDSLWKIGQAYGVTHQELAAANRLQVDASLPVGKVLVIPAGGKFVPPEERPKAAAPAVKPAAGAAQRPSPAVAATPASGQRQLNSDGTYTVRPNDSLWLIARDFKVQVKDIRDLNNLTTDVLQVDQKLKMPGAGGMAASTPPAGGAVRVTAEPKPTVVQPGTAVLPPTTGQPLPTAPINMLDYTVTNNDSLQNIADMFSIGVDDIVKANPGVKTDADLRPNMNLRIPLN